MTAEQLEAARAERLRHNGTGTLVIDDARTWVEETGLCLFFPKKHATPAVAPSFLEAVAGQTFETPDPKIPVLAEDLLVRMELTDVAVRLNLHGVPGLQPDYVVAAWVLPYVYALRGDRDWRRTPQLTGSRAVSPLAIQIYKKLEQGDMSIPQLRTALGREVTESAVLRGITELWQQLRIIPVTPAPGATPKWQLLRHRFQKAIAEGASTSQVTAISVLASIYLQAVIAASMEEVELFLAPLTSRSKVREVIRGLVATRQVNTTNVGHSSYFYVAGTLPEFPALPSAYSSSSLSSYGYRGYDDDSDGGLGRMYASAHSSSRPAFGYATTPNGATSNGTSSNGTGHAESVSSESEPSEKRQQRHSDRSGSWSSRKPSSGAKRTSSGSSPRTSSGSSSRSSSRTASSGSSRTSSGARSSSARPAARKPVKARTVAKPAGKRLVSAGKSTSGKRR